MSTRLDIYGLLSGASKPASFGSSHWKPGCNLVLDSAQFIAIFSNRRCLTCSSLPANSKHPVFKSVQILFQDRHVPRSPVLDRNPTLPGADTAPYRHVGCQHHVHIAPTNPDPSAVLRNAALSAEISQLLLDILDGSTSFCRCVLLLSAVHVHVHVSHILSGTLSGFCFATPPNAIFQFLDGSK